MVDVAKEADVSSKDLRLPLQPRHDPFEHPPIAGCDEPCTEVYRRAGDGPIGIDSIWCVAIRVDWEDHQYHNEPISYDLTSGRFKDSTYRMVYDKDAPEPGTIPAEIQREVDERLTQFGERQRHKEIGCVSPCECFQLEREVVTDSGSGVFVEHVEHEEVVVPRVYHRGFVEQRKRIPDLSRLLDGDLKPIEIPIDQETDYLVPLGNGFHAVKRSLTCEVKGTFTFDEVTWSGICNCLDEA